MNQINGRGTWIVSKLALPHLKASAKAGRNPHILTLSPPLDMRPHWFGPHVAYTMAKYAMSMCVLGLSRELESEHIAVNALWPMTAIDTAAVSNVIATDQSAKTRSAEIMSDAAYMVLVQPPSFTGHFVIDEVMLRHQGVTDFTRYKLDPKTPDDELTPDFFLPERVYDMAPPPIVLAHLFAKL